MSLQLGFIGTGNMAKQFIKGFLNAGLSPENIYITSRHVERLSDYAKNLQLALCTSNEEIVKKADIIFLGVHPEDKDDVLKEIAPFFDPENQILIPFLTGVCLKDITEVVGPLKITRLMPNLNVAVNQGSMAICFNEEMDTEDQTLVTSLLEKVGTLYPLEEKDFSTFVALAASAPAFVYLFIDTLSRSAVKYGFSKELSTKIVSEMVAGSGLLSATLEKTPIEWMDAVSSPGGSTIEGVIALEKSDFQKAIYDAFDATLLKDQRKR